VGKSDQLQTPNRPDLTAGLPASSLDDGVPLLGHVQGEPVIVVRRGAEIFAIGATCSHYRGPLTEGLVVDDTVRCPWHHACFSLRTGVHYDIPINYVGHAERWEAIEIAGSLQRHDCRVRYRAGGRVLARASIFRDRENLEAELALEQEVRP
jgi:nitrite reductase/ring-hydroxylating ferredoxin subunit